jgi:EmrB/QacA subfamily drug resistance transporter
LASAGATVRLSADELRARSANGPGDRRGRQDVSRPLDELPAAGRGRDYRIVALTVSVPLFMQFLDSTVLTTALPAIARDLGRSPLDLNVTLLAYQLAMTMFIPVGSALGNRFGAKPMFAAALCCFLLGSLLCGLSGTLPALVASRTVQGIGGALLMPLCRAIVVRSSRRSDLLSAMNWLLVPAILGPLLGPPLGGFITSYASWHYIFFINVPVGIVGLAAGLIVIPAIPREPVRFDLFGMVLVAPALAALVFGLETAAGGNLVRAVPLLAVAVLFGGAYIRHSRQSINPLLDLRILAIRTFRTSLVLGSMVRGLGTACSFLLPLMLQLALGKTPIQSGWLTFAIPLGALASRLLSNWLLKRITVRASMLTGLSVSISTTLALAALGPQSPHWLIGALLATFGWSTTMSLVVISAMAYVEIPDERAGDATGLYTTLQQLSFSLGVVGGVAAAGVGGWLVGGDSHSVATYSAGFLIIAAASCWALMLALRLPSGVGEELRR